MDKNYEDKIIDKIEKKIRMIMQDSKIAKEKDIFELTIDDGITTVAEFAQSVAQSVKKDEYSIYYDDEDIEESDYIDEIKACVVLADFVKYKEILSQELAKNISFKIGNACFIVDTKANNFLMFKLVGIGNNYLFIPVCYI